MIFVHRPEVPDGFAADPLREIELGRIGEWFSTPLAQREREEYSYKYTPGRIKTVREALWKIFAGKCAYCEVKLGGDRLDNSLTFYRPRQNALQNGTYSPDHYWWLSWEWSNLYLACSTCMRRKGQKFPTANNRRAKAGTLGVALLEEEPLLLDPCSDEPAAHLSFRETGEVEPEGGSARGDATIKVLGLNRDTLVSKRREYAREVKSLLRSCLQAAARHDGHVGPNLASRIRGLGSLCEADRQFAGMIRQLLRRWLRGGESGTADDFPRPSLGDAHWRELISRLEDGWASPRAAASGRNSTVRPAGATHHTAMNRWPKSLERAVEQGRVIPFAGAGVAMALRDFEGRPLVPDWRGLLNAAADWLDDEQRPEDATLLRQRLSLDSTFAEAFRTAHRELGTEFLSFMQDKLDPPHEAVDGASLELARALWGLSSNFVVTIGHDRALKWGCPDQSALELIEAVQVSDVMRRMGEGALPPTLWYAFGTLEGGDPIITFDAHRSLVPDPISDAALAATADSLQELFAGPYSVVFVSTSAPYFFSTQLFKSAFGKKHYWLVRQDDFERCQRSLRERDLPMIQPVAFPDYESLPRLLNELAGRRRAAAAPPPRQKTVAAPTPNPPATVSRSSKQPDEPGVAAPATEPFDVAIICALREPELEKVLQTGKQPWEPLTRQPNDPHTYRHTVYTTAGGKQLRVVAAAQNHMGMAASAVLTTKMILRFSPKLVVMVGIAAGVKTESQGFGDILAAEHTFDYESGKVVTERNKVVLKPDPKPLDIDPRLHTRLKEWQANGDELDAIRRSWQGPKPDKVLRLHLGPLGSGAAVIDNPGRVKEVTQHWRKLIGVEMEAYAVHRACRDAVTPAPIYLCLKSICDFAEKKGDAWQPYAAFTAAQLCHRFLVAEWENLFG